MSELEAGEKLISLQFEDQHSLHFPDSELSELLKDASKFEELN